MQASGVIRRGISHIAVSIMVIGGAGLAVGFSTDAHAEEVGDQPTVGIEDIVVTAERRLSSAQKTPLTLTVIDGDALAKEGVLDTQQLASLVPGVQVGESSRAAVQIAIRGIYSASNEADPSTAFHVDGLYYTRPSGANAVFYDLERIEVLRGPQGTLWGRNATAGAVNVITRKPEFDLGGSFDTSYGNYDSLKLTGVLNVPVIDDKWAVRGAFLYADRDAYEFNTAPGARHPGVKDTALRLHSLFTPTERVSFLVSGDYSRMKGQSASFIYPGAGYSKRDNPNAAYADVESWSARAEITVDLGDVQLVSLSAYRVEDQYNESRVHGITGNGQYNLARPLNLTLDIKDSTISQEIRLASTGDGPFTWTLGGNYLDEKIDEVFNLVIVPNLNSNRQVRPNQGVQSIGLFGNVKFAVTDTVSLIGGLRYSKDTKKNIGGINTRLTNGVPSVTLENIQGSWNRLDWKAGVDWQVTPNSLVYATVSTGYKAGGIANSVYDPEKLLAYEIGSKNQFFDHRLQLNGALFWYDYTDLQVGQVINGRFVTANASSADIKGAELEFQAVPVDGLRFSGSVSYIDGKYGNYQAVNVAQGNAIVQVKGNRIQRAPKFTSRLSASYTADLGSVELTVGGDWSYQSKVYFSEFEDLGPWALAVQKPVSTFDAKTRLEFAEGRYFVDAYIKNITNKDVANSIGYYTPAQTIFASYAPPRTYGFRVGANF